MWSQPQNLGPSINTKYDEDSPFFDIDESSLYFSSRGHKNMGDYDIFKSDLKEDGTWSEPENLGYPINTVKDDRFLVISSDGRRGYMSSERKEGFGSSDIQMIEMPFNKKDFKIVRFKITDDISGLALNADLYLTDSLTGKLIGIYRPNKKTGNYVIPVKHDVKYIISIKCEGYNDFSKEIFIPFNFEDNDVILENILLSKNK